MKSDVTCRTAYCLAASAPSRGRAVQAMLTMIHCRPIATQSQDGLLLAPLGSLGASLLPLLGVGYLLVALVLFVQVRQRALVAVQLGGSSSSPARRPTGCSQGPCVPP